MLFTPILLCYDAVFGLLAKDMTFYGQVLVLFMGLTSCVSAVNLYYFKDTELKYSGIALQLRVFLVSFFCMSSDSMIIKNPAKYLELLMKCKLGISILGFYVGIYHSLVTKDMFPDQNSQILYI